MDMSLDKTGNHRAAGRVDYGVRCLVRIADLGYAFVTNEKIAAHDGVRRVHRHERAVFDED
jgi:DNA-binding IscR family transcriptional regulator